MAWHPDRVRTEDAAVLATGPGPAATLLDVGAVLRGISNSWTSHPALAPRVSAGELLLPHPFLWRSLSGLGPWLPGVRLCPPSSGLVRARAVVWWVNETFIRLDRAGGWRRLQPGGGRLNLTVSQAQPLDAQKRKRQGQASLRKPLGVAPNEVGRSAGQRRV